MSGDDEDHIAEFFIICDNPSLWYTPGERVTGVVVLRPKKDLKVHELYVKFGGYANVNWTEVYYQRRKAGHSFFGSKTSFPRRSHTIRHYIYYNNMQTFFDVTQYFASNENNASLMMPMGHEESFNFGFKLPSHIPSSLKSELGNVEYFLEARLNGSIKISGNIFVHQVLDLSHITGAFEPAESVASESFPFCFCWCSGPLTLCVKLSSRAYYLGDILPFQVEVHNQSRKGVDDLTAEVEAQIVGHAQKKTNIERNTAVEVKRGTGVSSPGTSIWAGELLIPDTGLAPSGLGGHCSIIELNYFLKVVADLSGCCNDTMEVYCPILLGSRPLPNNKNKKLSSCSSSSSD